MQTERAEQTPSPSKQPESLRQQIEGGENGAGRAAVRMRNHYGASGEANFGLPSTKAAVLLLKKEVAK